MEAFVQFPLDPNSVTSFSDANWGPQDASEPKPNQHEQLELFKSRSIAGFLVWLNGPLHWQSKRQTYTAQSSAEAEIGSVDDCTKALQQIRNILQDLNIFSRIQSGPITIHNDNNATVKWSYNMTTKGLRYIQMRENAVRENVQSNFIKISHIQGKINPTDIHTKEDRDVPHFEACRDSMVVDPPIHKTIETKNRTTSHQVECEGHQTLSSSHDHVVKGGVVRLPVPSSPPGVTS